MIVPKIDVANCISQLGISLEHASDMLEAMLTLAEAENCPAPLLTMNRLTRQLLAEAKKQQIEIVKWCQVTRSEQHHMEIANAERARRRRLLLTEAMESNAARTGRN